MRAMGKRRQPGRLEGEHPVCTHPLWGRAMPKLPRHPVLGYSISVWVLLVHGLGQGGWSAGRGSMGRWSIGGRVVGGQSAWMHSIGGIAVRS